MRNKFNLGDLVEIKKHCKIGALEMNIEVAGET